MKVVRKWTVEKKQLKKWEKGRMVVMVDGGMGRASPFLRGWAAAAMSGEWQPGTKAGGRGAKDYCNSGHSGCLFR